MFEIGKLSWPCLFADSDVNALLGMLRDPVFLIFGGSAMVAVVAIAGYYWFALRTAQLDASLKQEMLARGMSAAEIQAVLAASSKGTDKETS